MLIFYYRLVEIFMFFIHDSNNLPVLKMKNVPSRTIEETSDLLCVHSRVHVDGYVLRTYSSKGSSEIVSTSSLNKHRRCCAFASKHRDILRNANNDSDRCKMLLLVNAYVSRRLCCDWTEYRSTSMR